MPCLLEVYVCEKDFHPNVKAKQVVVPNNSSGFLDSSLNGSVVAPQIMSEVQSLSSVSALILGSV